MERDLRKYILKEAIAALMGYATDSASATPEIGAYYQSWSANCVWWPDVYCDLANVSPYVNNIFLSFASPTNQYDASNANCLGLQFPTPDPKALQLSISKLR